MFTGTWEWLIILAVVVLLFGGSKLPKLGGALGESIKNFRRGIGEGSSSTAAESPSLLKNAVRGAETSEPSSKKGSETPS